MDLLKEKILFRESLIFWRKLQEIEKTINFNDIYHIWKKSNWKKDFEYKLSKDEFPDIVSSFPDKFLNMNLIPAACQHDIDYLVGGTEDDRKKADDRFLKNLILDNAEHETFCFILYRTVRLFGKKHFCYI